MHTDYSLLDSCTKPQEYIDLAVKNNIKALSFSEHGKNLNWLEKWAACKEVGIKYIHSVEIYLTESLEEKVRDNYHTVLLSRNRAGLEELNNLISMSTDSDHFYYTNRISFNEFLSISDNIISTSACLASPLNKLPEDHPMYMELARKYDFLEVQAHHHPEQIEFNKRLLKLSKILNKPLIAGTDTHSSSEYKAECRSVLMASKNKSYSDEDAFDLTFKTYDELVDMFRSQNALPQEEYMSAIENTNLLYDLTEDVELDTSIKYPISYGTREADSKKLAEMTEEMLDSKIKNNVIPQEQKVAFEEAIKEELKVFKELNMEGFMLSMAELLCWCRENGIAIGPGRGSVGGSRVAYVTDITDLNPETWRTVFSRFANQHRVEIGDIDIDCVESDRPKIFNHIINKYGSDKTARVASFGTMQAKTVIDDVGRYFAKEWDKTHVGGDNPWSLPKIAKIKKEFDANEEATKKKYKQLFYYLDGMLGTKNSQSVHPAGMVISPITLADNYGTFYKDGEICLVLDMDIIHDYTGLAKYDFLVLKTVQVIRDACNYINSPYPKAHEVNWYDEAVWDDMITSPIGLFQFESKFSFDCLKRFAPKSIFDMAIVTACIRPSGTSYRDELLSRKVHKNPSKIIDDLLESNLGYLIYQEDTIKFLQQICGLSGGEADNVRRAIGRKQKDRLDKAMPDILQGYCDKSQQPKEIAEQEAKEFLQIIEDSASYQFGYNHAVAYCLLGYLCAYYRYYYPIEFITSFLNNAANDEDIRNGTNYANKIGIKILMPKWGISKGDYFYDKEKNVIAKGIASIKYMNAKKAEILYQVAQSEEFTRFFDVLLTIDKDKIIDSRQLDTLIKVDYFSQFGNQRELLLMADMFDTLFKKGSAKSISKEKVNGTLLQPIISKYAVGVTKSGGEAKSYTILDIVSIMREAEQSIKELHMDDLEDVIKVKNFADVMGYMGYISGKEEDRRKLYILDIFPLARKKDNKQFGYSIITKSIGSGKESRFTVFNKVFEKSPIKKGDVIFCNSYDQEGKYFKLTRYRIIK